ncbi:methyl-accepting chemotaxis protein [Brasilonema sp. UFV-L1]|uniref:methyl-accepting chemotaxis protein n=1 Tax=Brasilonema sp. UFV-L1 TaxID=2234130 RepID=UPI002006E21D|nr:methyl-accepting chemotaxis protein [Brasilonema sp. UFV-L1]
MSLSKWFYNLPISRKQLIALIASELVSVLGIGIGATLIIINGLRTQLLEQAKSEVAVVDTNYNIKINQMGFGFRGQSDNTAIIKASVNYNSSKSISSDLKAEVKRILVNEIKARKIEYATLVGKDFKIIVNANKNREGEVFNPNNLVSDVFKNPKQIKASRIVSWSELSKESPPLPNSFSNQDALIRYTVTPVRDPKTSTVVGALVSGDIVNGKDPIVRNTLQATGGGYSAVYLRQPTGKFTLATSLDKGQTEDLNQAQLNVKLPKEGEFLLKEAARSTDGKAVTGRIFVGNQTYTIAAKAVPNKIVEEAEGPQTIFDGHSSAILVRGTPETALNYLLLQSLLEQALTVVFALIIIAIWAVILRRTIIQPIENLQQTAQKFAAGDRSSRAEIFSTDEVGQLAVNFNIMAQKLVEQIRYQENETKVAMQLNEITTSMRESLDTKKILKAAVSSTRKVIQVERVLFYRLDENYLGTVIAKSVNYEGSAALKTNLTELFHAEEHSQDYTVSGVKAVENIYEADLSEQYIKQLESFAVKAYLLAPIFLNKKLYGLLVAHQCSNYRKWQDIEITLFKQVAIQVGYALEQSRLLQDIEQSRQLAQTASIEERKQKEALKMQLLELLNDIEDAAKGDLTVRAEVKQGEIGTVADFFNSIVESLRLIVTKVKLSALQVNQAIGTNSGAIRELAEEALTQAEEINRTLDAVDNMTQSIEYVAQSAQQAALIANSAAQTAKKSGIAMDMTVQNILYLRETVGETSKKVKRLGESTQQISRVVALINQISMQTNLLSINAGIEAARAGEEGQGFAVVAEEIGELAARSAVATTEIEQIVENIRRETTEVVQAMELGTTQVVEGTRIVEDAKENLAQILEISQQIDALVQSISLATTSQAQTSYVVSQLMQDIAACSQRTSDSSIKVSQSLQQTVEISQQLQATVGTFKVNLN